jgi:hypothetical protein
MTEPTERLEENIRQTAQAFPYPPTPAVARSVTRRLSATPRPMVMRSRLAWTAVALALILALALSIPQVRAGIIDFLRLGGVRIVLTPPTPTATLPPPTGTGGSETRPNNPTVTPRPTPILLSSLLNLRGETTLADAQSRAGFTLSLPTYPTDLGQPDYVFFQHFGGEPVVIFVWLDPTQPDKVRLSLHLLTCKECVTKMEPKRIATTAVNGNTALWTEGPYFVELSNGDIDLYRLIEGHVLIWTDGPITYRLETDLAMEEAVKIAESLQPLP